MVYVSLICICRALPIVIHEAHDITSLDLAILVIDPILPSSLLLRVTLLISL